MSALPELCWECTDQFHTTQRHNYVIFCLLALSIAKLCAMCHLKALEKLL